MMKKILFLAVTVILSCTMCGCSGKSDKDDAAADSIRRADSVRRADSLFEASLPLTPGQVLAANLNDTDTQLLLATNPEDLKPQQLAAACLTSLYYVQANKEEMSKNEEKAVVQYIVELYDRGMDMDAAAFEKTVMYYKPENISDFSQFSQGINHLRKMTGGKESANN